MTRELLQHVVEEADAGRYVALAGAVEIDGRRDVGLLGLARDGGLPLQSRPLGPSLGPSLRRRNRAFISLSPAVKDPPCRARLPVSRQLGCNCNAKRRLATGSTPILARDHHTHHS